jgi:hypothetical protein
VGLMINGGLTITSRSDKNLYGELINFGIIVHTNAGGGTAPLWVHGGSRIFNAGLVDIQGDGPSISVGDGSTSVFANTADGAIRKTGGTGAVTLAVSFFTNSGIVDVQKGTLNLAASGTSSSLGAFSVVNGAALNFSGGTFTVSATPFQGTGVVGVTGGTLRIAGYEAIAVLRMTSGTLELTPGSYLDAGSYTQTGGTLLVDVAGPLQGDYGRLRVEGQAQLGGGVSVRFVNNYVPKLGDIYTFLSYGSRGNPSTGFGGTAFPSMNGMHCVLSDDQTSIVVKAG